MKRVANAVAVAWAALMVALPAIANEPEVEPALDGGDSLEFRSVVTLDGESRYSLHDRETGSSFWVSENELRNGIEIVHFDPDANVLMLYVDDELRELPLSPSIVVDVSEAETPPPGRGERRRQARQERRERFEAFRETWDQAIQESPQLSELERELRVLAAEFRETRGARRAADRGTDQRRMLREQERAVHEELRLMSEYTALRASQSTAFQAQEDEEVDRLRRMFNRLAFSRGGGR